MPMGYSSTNTFFFQNNGMEGEVIGSRPIRCVCRPKKKVDLMVV